MNWSESMLFVKSKLAGSVQEDQVDGGKHEYWASISEWICLFWEWSVPYTKVDLGHRNLTRGKWKAVGILKKLVIREKLELVGESGCIFPSKMSTIMKYNFNFFYGEFKFTVRKFKKQSTNEPKKPQAQAQPPSKLWITFMKLKYFN